MVHSTSKIVWVFVDTREQVAFQLMWTISDFWYQWQLIKLQWAEWLRIWLNSISFESDKLIDFLSSLSIEETWKEYTGSHLHRVRSWAEIFWAELVKRGTIDENKAKIIALASPLHDIWKIDIPEDILYGWNDLSEIELLEMKMWHVLHWYSLLYWLDNLPDVAMKIVYWHHEKWDWSWYPLGKKWNSIPIEAQVISIVDYFDALTSIRPYRGKRFTGEQVMWFIESECTKHFNPLLVDAFKKCYMDIPIQGDEEAESMMVKYHWKNAA